MKQQIKWNKIRSIKYSQLTSQIDKQNKEVIQQINQNYLVEHEGNYSESDQILKMDNSLIRKYTDAVYHQYQIGKPLIEGENSRQVKRNKSFKMKSRINSECLNQQNLEQGDRKLIELKIGKINMKTPKLQVQSIRFSNSNTSKISSHNSSKPRLPMKSKHLFNQSSDYTPVRRAITKTKKYVNSTATGTTLNKSNNQNIFPINHTHHGNFHSSQKQKKNQDQIYVSQFDDGSSYSHRNIDTESCKFQPRQKQTVKLRSKSSKFIINSIIGNEGKQKNVFCPICQSALNQNSIEQHEKLCKQLQQLYNLSIPKLIQFINWKVEYHQSSICKQISNIGEQLIETKLEQGKKAAQGRQQCIKNTIEQCEEEVKKCLWFQDIKAQLIVKFHEFL